MNDEPELTSFPANTASDIQELIKSRIPEAPTCMAVVRPGNCRDYLDAADFFMMDQYPVPNKPMTWLSDSIDRASAIAGNERIIAVIQAFGGEAYESSGWPRVPTWREMDCLAFLSIVHGSRGIFFFTFSEIGKTKEGRESLGRVVGRLNWIYPWLLENNLDVKVPVEMTSGNKFDPSGRPAVHCCIKAKGENRLIIAVNAIGTHVDAQIGTVSAAGDGKDAVFTEIYSGKKYPVIDGRIFVKFDPYETKAFLSKE